ncbi:SAM-dependent methyltransferase [Kitasatospora sp. NPDC050543]|uniref:SAM-dependent methyltransferase n=1 Tax=Kitasatospora sp. NPDC050543 TaxID=3364054 RepID=UPI00379668DA
MTTSQPMSAVSRTALAVAGVRALESARPQGLFNDPYAAAFVAASGEPQHPAASTTGPAGPGGRPEPASALAKALRFQTVIRTRFYDDHLLAAGCRQVVLLAAGLDTRAYRLSWPSGTRLYELDLPPVLEFKEGVLTGLAAVPRCERTALPADLLDPRWPDLLRGAGFDPAEPTAWLAEGLLVYLTAEQAAALLGAVGELSRPGSRLALERARTGTTALDDPSLAHITSLWRGGLGPDTANWLDGHGWSTETHPLDAVAARYGRPVTGPSHTGYLTAVRR